MNGAMNGAVNMVEHLRRLFAYDAWANGQTLASLAAARTVSAPAAPRVAPAAPRAAPPERARRFMAHVVATEKLWLGRLEEDRTPPGQVWPDLTLERCQEEADSMVGLWKPYLDSLVPSRLAETIPYTNTRGESWTSAIGDILMHVVLHSAYHRGQIASELSTAGFEPATTDFIHGVRQGLIESSVE